LAAQDGLSNSPCQSASDVGALSVPVQEFLLFHLKRVIEANQRKIRIRANGNTALFFRGWARSKT